MLATAGAAPTIDGDPPRWAAEMKWDGVRGVVGVTSHECRILSRGGNNLADAFPDLCGALRQAAEGRELVLDTELVAPDAAGVPRFNRIARRIRMRNPGAKLISELPAQAFVFDVLDVDGVDTMGLPYIERRNRLTQLRLSAPGVVVPPHWVNVPLDRMLEVAAEHDIEGVMLKRLDSLYRPGVRSKAWIKIPLRRSCPVVLVGWLAGWDKNQSSLFRSLLVAAHDPDAAGALVLLGSVGSGFSALGRRQLQAQLDELTVEDCPLDVDPPLWTRRCVTWLRPVLVGAVEYRERTSGGLRHAVWRGLLPGRLAEEVRMPPN
ncbi:ATP-dependent DNA ligase [Nocardia asiatica]|uniref:ATP-dependent DNA ligase n=1 Tax=Nocardia asiatica TaxID=209252 RepID=UPI0005C1F2E5|nr:hypothetical protein [Nocardia asiatica]